MQSEKESWCAKECFEVMTQSAAKLTRLQFAVLRYFSEQPGHLFAIVDSAHGSQVMTLLKKGDVESTCLYEGKSAETLANYAPYLVILSRECNLMTDLVHSGWQKAWATYYVSSLSLADLRTHFRRFLLVEDPNGKQCYFRFYDPRVLRTFLPTLDGDEVRNFFGPVQFMVMEAERPENLLRFRPGTGKAECEAISLHTADLPREGAL